MGLNKDYGRFLAYMPHIPVNTDTGSLPQGGGEQRPCHRKELLSTEGSSTPEFAGVFATSVSLWEKQPKGQRFILAHGSGSSLN